MKYIIAVIQPDRLEDVLEQLEEREVHLVTVSDVMGRGRQKGAAEIYRSHVEPGNPLRKVKLEIAVNDDYLEPALGAIRAGAHHEDGPGPPCESGAAPAASTPARRLLRPPSSRARRLPRPPRPRLRLSPSWP